jgi:hypothetical protein
VGLRLLQWLNTASQILLPLRFHFVNVCLEDFWPFLRFLVPGLLHFLLPLELARLLEAASFVELLRTQITISAKFYIFDSRPETSLSLVVLSIVLVAAGGIFQGIVGIDERLENLGCIFVVSIFVRVKLKRQLLVSCFYLYEAASSGNSKDFVIVRKGGRRHRSG